MPATNLIVLKKVPFQESSLIISGLSAEHGKLDFLIKGAFRTGKKKFPAVDLFREIQADYRDQHHRLQSLYKVELVKAFDNVAANPQNYLEACATARFVLKNIHPGVESPELYQALHTALDRWSGSAPDVKQFPHPKAIGALVKLAFLDEHGMLPEQLHQAAPDNHSLDQQRELLDKLINAAAGSSPPPELPETYWHKLDKWINALCSYQGMSLDQG